VDGEKSGDGPDHILRDREWKILVHRKLAMGKQLPELRLDSVENIELKFKIRDDGMDGVGSETKCRFPHLRMSPS
jgi:hypothetical protein